MPVLVCTQSNATEGGSGSQRRKALSEACLRRLKHVVRLVNQIDLAAANELHTCKRIEALSMDRSKPQKLLTQEEMQRLEEFHLSVMNHRSIIAAIRTEGEIRTYLSDTECIPDWLLGEYSNFSNTKSLCGPRREHCCLE